MFDTRACLIKERYMAMLSIRKKVLARSLRKFASDIVSGLSRISNAKNIYSDISRPVID